MEKTLKNIALTMATLSLVLFASPFVAMGQYSEEQIGLAGVYGVQLTNEPGYDASYDIPSHPQIVVPQGFGYGSSFDFPLPILRPLYMNTSDDEEETESQELEVQEPEVRELALEEAATQDPAETTESVPAAPQKSKRRLIWILCLAVPILPAVWVLIKTIIRIYGRVTEFARTKMNATYGAADSIKSELSLVRRRCKESVDAIAPRQGT